MLLFRKEEKDMKHELPVAVILPFFNNKELIDKASSAIVKVLKRLIDKDLISESSHLILVDNNSDNESWIEAGKAVAKNPRLVRAIKLNAYVKTSVIFKKAARCRNIVVDFNNYQKIEEYILKSQKGFIADKLYVLKDLFKSSQFVVIDEFS